MHIMSLTRDVLFIIINSVNLVIFNKFYHMNISSSARISPGAYLDKTNPRGIHIDDGSFVAYGAMILAHDNCRNLHKDTYIGRDCFIGARAIILAGVSIGDHVIVGAGSIVTKNVQPNCIVAGNPAKIITENINTTKYGILVKR